VALTLDELKTVTNRLYMRLQSRRRPAEQAMAYYRGEQGALQFATKEFQESSGKRYDGFSDNWCQPVASAGAERTAWRGIKLPGSAVGRLSPDESLLWGALQDNDVDAQFAQAFLHAPIQKRSFVSVWGVLDGPDAGEPSVMVESATQAIVEYDPEVRRKRKYGFKVYVDDKWEYGTLSDADYIYPMRRPLSAMTGISLSGIISPQVSAMMGQSDLIVPQVKGRPWQLITDPIPNHLHDVPLVELPYRPMLDGKGPMSDIQGVMSMQDAVNLLWAYMFNAADFASLPARIVMGQAPPKVPVLDENGIKVGERTIDPKELTAGRLLWLPSVDAKVGSWEPASLDGFSRIIEQLVGHIAAQSRTPAYYLMSQAGMSNVSPEGVETGEAGLVMKVHASQEQYNGGLRDVAVLVARQLGEDALARQCRRAQIIWKNPRNPSPAQAADAFQKYLAAGFPFEYLLSMDGRYSPAEITEIMDMKAAEDKKTADAAAKAADALQPVVSKTDLQAQVTPLAGSEAPQPNSKVGVR